MNERIKELLVKSGIDFGPFESVTIDIDNAKEFAELIVRECIDVLDKAVYLATREDGEQEHIDVVLLEHFDIEEN